MFDAVLAVGGLVLFVGGLGIMIAGFVLWLLSLGSRD